MSARPVRASFRARRRATAIAAALALAATLPAPAARAQLVGHEPGASPFTDVAPTQQLSLSAGWLSLSRDPAGVALDAAPVTMLRHDIAIGGPAWLTSRYGVAFSERDVLDPSLPGGDRGRTRRASALHIADVGLSLALTGRKAYRGVVPTLQASVGLASDFTGADVGQYSFGTKFAFSYGLGIRYLLDNGWSVRADVSSWFFQYEYPDSYFVPPTDGGDAILPADAGRDAWRNNLGLTVGLSLPLGGG